MSMEIHKMLFSFAAGIVIGLFYFGGLWWTVRRLPDRGEPALWALGSFLLRAAITLAGFYFAAGGEWMRILACLLGFVLVRMTLVFPFLTVMIMIR